MPKPAMVWSANRLAIAAAAVGVGATAAAAMSVGKHTPLLRAQSTKWNSAILSLCPALTSPYSLPTLLNNGHVETIYAALFRKSPHLLYDRELVRMPDGGVVAVDTEDVPPEKVTPSSCHVPLARLLRSC
jgi:hypothetical protein